MYILRWIGRQKRQNSNENNWFLWREREEKNTSIEHINEEKKRFISNHVCAANKTLSSFSHFTLLKKLKRKFM